MLSQNFITILRKLGVLRFGTFFAKYTSSKNMPAQFLMDNVYDEEKDLIHKGDVSKYNLVKWFIIVFLVIFALSLLFVR